MHFQLNLEKSKCRDRFYVEKYTCPGELAGSGWGTVRNNYTNSELIGANN
jgi:hypothetical protein